MKTNSVQTMFSGQKIVDQFWIKDGLRDRWRWLKTRTSATLVCIPIR